MNFCTRETKKNINKMIIESRKNHYFKKLKNLRRIKKKQTFIIRILFLYFFSYLYTYLYTYLFREVISTPPL